MPPSGEVLEHDSAPIGHRRQLVIRQDGGVAGGFPVGDGDRCVDVSGPGSRLGQRHDNERLLGSRNRVSGTHSPDDESKALAKALIEAVILRHEAQRWADAS